MATRRLDEALIEKGIAEDREQAFVMVTAGSVFVNGQRAVSPSAPVGADARIEIRAAPPYVGRAAHKLEAAMRAFGADATGSVCADIGSATGGFVEILLKYGAAKVYAIEAGRGKLDAKLREDPRVVALEGINVLAMRPLPERPALITIDVSLTPLRLVLFSIRPLLAPGGRVIALFKPQYEILDKSRLRHGVLEDAELRTETLTAFGQWLGEHRWRELGRIESPIRGSEGNVEYLFYLQPA